MDKGRFLAHRRTKLPSYGQEPAGPAEPDEAIAKKQRKKTKTETPKRPGQGPEQRGWRRLWTSTTPDQIRRQRRGDDGKSSDGSSNEGDEPGNKTNNNNIKPKQISKQKV